jgi:hypothetical protein
MGLDDTLSIAIRDTDAYYLVRGYKSNIPEYGFMPPDPVDFIDGHDYSLDATAYTLTDITPPPDEGDWLDSLVSFWASLSNTMASWAAAAAAWVWPLNIIAPLVVAVSSIVDGIFGGMLDFRVFYRTLELRVSELLDFDELLDRLSEPLDQLAALWAWFSDWAGSVGSLIADWWAGVEDTVLSWISVATQGLDNVLIAWETFTTEILPTLFDLEFAEEWYRSKLVAVGQLITSAFTERADLWAGWSDFRQSVSDIVSTPFDWLEARFTDWFLGGE